MAFSQNKKDKKLSGVFARNRAETKLQFYVNALNLQVAITQYVSREKIIPKKWRFNIGYDLIKKVDILVDLITIANSIYPQNWRELFLRKLLQTLAIALCFCIQNKLVLAEKCIQTVKVEDLEKIIELLVHEIELLKGWKKTTKIIKE